MFGKLDILQVYSSDHPPLANRALRFAALLAHESGAELFRSGDAPGISDFGFYDMPETSVGEIEPERWATEAEASRHRIILQSSVSDEVVSDDGVSRVVVQMAPWQTEDTLITGAGVSNMFGEPDGPPIVPAGNFGAHTVGYALYGALFAVGARACRFGEPETAAVRADDVWAWVNWKSAIASRFGMTLFREGSDNFWPVLPCSDGFVAFLFRPTDLPAVVEMVGDPELAEIARLDWKMLRQRREDFFKPIRAWCLRHSKAQIAGAFARGGIPGAPVLTPRDLLDDELFRHRGTFRKTGSGRSLPVPPFRIEKEAPSPIKARPLNPTEQKPLSGFRVLDFGIIGAGAGTSTLLADLGAEVIKVESPDRPDPFRVWAALPTPDAQKTSPLFMSKNRNKTAVGIDLKTPEGRTQALELVKSADIVLENYRRGVFDRLGMDFDTLRAANPTILLASISGMGVSGPGVQAASFGSTLEANAGFGSLTRSDSDQPYVSGPNLNYPDQIVNLAASAYVAAAAMECRGNGVARHIDVSQRDCVIYQMGDIMGFVSGGGNDAPNSVRAALEPPILSGVLKCSDGEFVGLSALNSDVLDQLPGLESLAAEDVKEWAKQRTSGEVVEGFLKAGGGGVKAKLGNDLLADKGLMERNVFSHTPDGTLVQGFPFQTLRAPMTIELDSPEIGQHTQQVLSRL